jgi:hypothetical protein
VISGSDVQQLTFANFFSVSHQVLNVTVCTARERKCAHHVTPSVLTSVQSCFSARAREV